MRALFLRAYVHVYLTKLALQSVKLAEEWLAKKAGRKRLRRDAEEVQRQGAASNADDALRTARHNFLLTAAREGRADVLVQLHQGRALLLSRFGRVLTESEAAEVGAPVHVLAETFPLPALGGAAGTGELVRDGNIIRSSSLASQSSVSLRGDDSVEVALDVAASNLGAPSSAGVERSEARELEQEGAQAAGTGSDESSRDD